MIRPLVSLGLVLALFGVAGSSYGQAPPKPEPTPEIAAEARPPGADPKQQAEELFAKGRALMGAPGKLDEACSTLEQSQALMNRGDTLLNLAECHRRQGRTASAWKEFGQAIELAQEANFGPAIQVAKQRHTDLQAKLSFLTIVVPADLGALPGFAVTLNGYPVPKDAWGKPVPVDPGSFAIAASADGRQPFAATSQVGAESDKREVTVALVPLPPPPAPVPAPPPAAPPPAEAPPSGANGYVTLGIAGVGLITGVSFGIVALQQKASSSSGSFERAGTYGTVSIVSLGVAVIAGVIGGVEVAHNRRRAAAATAALRPVVVPLLGPKGGGAALGMEF